VQTDFSITCGTLKTKELEMIGKYVFGQDKDIAINYKDEYASFTFVEDNFLYKQENGFRQYDGERNISDHYYILAAGRYTEDYQNMWMIENYRDLGAAFKLSGLSGAIDYYIVKQNGGPDDVQLMRQYLSGNEEVIKTTLWY
jgi:hypothetical protein